MYVKKNDIIGNLVFVKKKIFIKISKWENEENL